METPSIRVLPCWGILKFNKFNHIDKVYERCAQRVGILRRLRRTFPSGALRRIYVGAVLPIMEYACPVWSGGPVAKLIHLHESFGRRNREVLQTESVHTNMCEPKVCSTNRKLIFRFHFRFGQFRWRSDWGLSRRFWRKPCCSRVTK